MPEVHASASVAPEAKLADDVVVGPHCVIRGPVELGAGCRLVGNVYLEGPLRMGSRNVVYPFTTLGFAPQDLGFDPARPGAGLVIGDDNVFRESVTIHRAASDETPTRIGDRNYWMVGAHAGHDCTVGNDCIFANGSMLGGAVELGDRVFVGGATAIHQHVRVGRGALLTGTTGLNMDLPPFFMLTGGNIAGSFNVVGMRRAGMPSDQIGDVKWAYKTIYRKGLSPRRALEALRERAERPLIAEYIAFIESSRRGIVPGVGDRRRGTA